MSAKNGDKSRHHRLRKAKISRRVQMRAMWQATRPRKRLKNSDTK